MTHALSRRFAQRGGQSASDAPASESSWSLGSARRCNANIPPWSGAPRARLVAVPAVAIALDRGSLWLLYVAAIGTGIAEVFYDTAAQSMLPQRVAAAGDSSGGALASH